MAKTKVICDKFFLDVTCQKLLKSANVLWRYSKNKSGMFLWTTVYVSGSFCKHHLCLFWATTDWVIDRLNDVFVNWKVLVLTVTLRLMSPAQALSQEHV